MTRLRLAVLASHPIQYRVPLFRALAASPGIDLHVFFYRQWGVEPYRDSGFRATFSWDIPLLEGYRYTFLQNFSCSPNPSSPLSAVNPQLITLLRPVRFDAVLIHDWALASNWMGWGAAVFRRLPILLRGETNGLNEPFGLKKRAKQILLKMFFSRIAGFLAIGTCNANFYRSYGVPEDRIFQSPYVVDNDFFMEHSRRWRGKKQQLRQEFGLPPELPLILFCGKFIEQKRPFDLLRAFTLLNRNGVKASLAFVGDGPLRAQMQQFVAKEQIPRVAFLGFKNQSELPACYAMADVLVLPSDREPWGLVVNEAMCFGLAVVASDKVGAAFDLVRSGVNGFVYPAGEVKTLAKGLQRILMDHLALQRMGEESLHRIGRWGMKECVNGILEGFHSISAGRN